MTDKKEHIRHSMKSTAPADCVTEISDTFYTRCGLYITTHPLHGTSLDNS